MRFPETLDAGAATSLRPHLDVLNQVSRPEVLDCFRGDERKKNRSCCCVGVGAASGRAGFALVDVYSQSMPSDTCT